MRFLPSAGLRIQRFREPEALHPNDVRADAFGDANFAADSATQGLHPYPVACLDAVLLRSYRVKPGFRNRVNLTQIWNVSERAVVVHRNAAASENERILLGDFSRGALCRLKVVGQWIVVLLDWRQLLQRIGLACATELNKDIAIKFKLLRRCTEALRKSGFGVDLLVYVILVPLVIRHVFDRIVRKEILPGHFDALQTSVEQFFHCVPIRKVILHEGRIAGTFAVLVAKFRAALDELRPEQRFVLGLPDVCDGLPGKYHVHTLDEHVRFKPFACWQQNVCEFRE